MVNNIIVTIFVMKFKQRLKELRSEKGMTQTDVARRLNMSKMAVSHWEKGNSEPSIEQLKALAAMFDTSVDYLVGFKDE